MLSSGWNQRAMILVASRFPKATGEHPCWNSRDAAGSLRKINARTFRQVRIESIMSDRRRQEWEISTLYLELAAECFNRSRTAADANATDTFHRMGHRYFVQAVALNPSFRLDCGSLAENDRKAGRPDRQGPYRSPDKHRIWPKQVPKATCRSKNEVRNIRRRPTPEQLLHDGRNVFRYCRSRHLDAHSHDGDR